MFIGRADSFKRIAFRLPDSRTITTLAGPRKRTRSLHVVSQARSPAPFHTLSRHGERFGLMGPVLSHGCFPVLSSREHDKLYASCLSVEGNVFQFI